MKATRRQFLGGASVAALSFWAGGTRADGDPAPAEKLKVAAIGVDGKGQSDSIDLARDNVMIALCDIDRNRLAAAAKRWPEAKLYTDYRRLFDECGDQLDAVSISTPDHQHAPAALRAMLLGIGTFVQKPMAHTVYESRLMRLTAKKTGVATQMGNQGTAHSMLRECVDVIQTGAIGPVTELHVWSNRPIWPQGIDRPAGEDPVPAHLDWDCFLGPAPLRPFKNNVYHPFRWRGWHDFGTGALGDMGCHAMNFPVWALQLGHPDSIELVWKSDDKPETYPAASIIRYEFPARGPGLPPVTFTWYDGGKKPPKELWQAGGEPPEGGVIMVGEKGILTSTAQDGSNYKLWPEADYKDYQAPENRTPKSVGHMKEFTNAVKGGEPAYSNFVDRAAPLTEMIVLGNLCLFSEKKLDWDGENLRVRNAPELEPHIRKSYRAGWELPIQLADVQETAPALPPRPRHGRR